jgi:nucleotide sugar dehydrogenase
MKPIEAEIVKISLNGYITTKISYANMISDLCDNVGADKHTVLYAIGSDSRIGNKYFRPGNSFGGPCFPRDTKALKQLMDQNDIESSLLAATTQYNQEHIYFQVQQLLREERDEYVVENVCYKENSTIPLIEESAKLKIAHELVVMGKKVTIVDVPELIDEVKKEYGNIFNYQCK